MSLFCLIIYVGNMSTKWIISIVILLTLVLSDISTANSSSAIANEEMRVSMKSFNVITNFIQKHNKDLSYREAYSIAYISYDASRKSEKISWTQLIAQQKVESHFDSKAVSHADAKGIPQIIHNQWDWYKPYKLIISNEEDLFIPEKSIPAQVVIMERFLDKHDGNMWRAIRNYCGAYSSETRDYVRDVLKYKKLLDKQQSNI